MLEDRGTLLHTFEGKKTIEKVYWHTVCYTNWFNENVKLKSNKTFEEALKDIVSGNALIKPFNWNNEKDSLFE